MPSLGLQNVGKRFGQTEVVSAVSLEIEHGE
jgi:ABC-type sugar transport system ATPase subunit